MDYLLNSAHRYRASKARFFSEFGFRVERETSFGLRYVMEGELDTPCGRRPRVRTVWQFDRGAVAPRLISAYPLEAKL